MNPWHSIFTFILDSVRFRWLLPFAASFQQKEPARQKRAPLYTGTPTFSHVETEPWVRARDGESRVDLLAPRRNRKRESSITQ